MNLRPSGYEPDELPDCSTPRRYKMIRLATSYSHRGKPPTTIGAEELNFRVRDGNGCDLFAIATRLYKVERIVLSKLDNKYCNRTISPIVVYLFLARLLNTRGQITCRLQGLSPFQRQNICLLCSNSRLCFSLSSSNCQTLCHKPSRLCDKERHFSGPSKACRV